MSGQAREGLDRGVHQGLWKAITVQEGEELRFELAASDPVAYLTVCQDPPQLGDAGRVGMAGDEVFEGERAVEASDFSFVDRAFELEPVEDRRQVEQSAGRRCCGNPIVSRDLVRRERSSVKTETGAILPPRPDGQLRLGRAP